jgi:hypothetical protein
MSTLILNDASLPFQSSEDCEQNLPVFFDILTTVLKNKVEMIRIDDSMGSNWFEFIYTQNFSLSSWIANQADKNYQRSLKTIMTKSCSPIIFPEEKSVLYTADLSCFKLKEEDVEVSSLGAAHLLNIPVVSFSSREIWQGNPIDIRHEYLNPTDEKISVSIENVENISTKTSLSSYVKNLTEERQASQHYLKSLTQSDNDDYPNLIFCKSALNNFHTTEASKNLLSKIIEVLTELNLCIERVSSISEIIDGTPLNISGESDKTKNASKLIKHRKFRLPNKEYYTFDLHVKNFPDAKRLYFHPDFQTNKITIGYFGKHLPI